MLLDAEQPVGRWPNDPSNSDAQTTTRVVVKQGITETTQNVFYTVNADLCMRYWASE